MTRPMAMQPDETDDIEDLSDLAEEADDSAVVAVPQAPELDWDEDEAATRIDPRVLGHSVQSAVDELSTVQDTTVAPPPGGAVAPPPRAGPPVPRARAETLLGVQAATPGTSLPAGVAFAPTVEAQGFPAPSPSAPVSPFMQVADVAPLPAPVFPEEAFEEGVAPDFEAAAAARLAASPAFAAVQPPTEPSTLEISDDELLGRRRGLGKSLLAIAGVAVIGAIVLGFVLYSIYFAKEPGTVVVRTTIPGAVVTVDGQPVGGNPGFFVASDLDPGPHTFTLMAPGIPPVTQIITVEEDRTIDAPVDLGGGTATAGIFPQGTGMPATALGGTASPAIAMATTGQPGTGTPATAVAGTAAPETAAPETAAPETAAPETAAPRRVASRTTPQKRTGSGGGSGSTARGGFGFLTVQTTPWSRVSVDGNLVGNTPIRRHRLSAGSHRVSMVNSDLNVRQTQRVTIHSNQETRLIRQLGR